MKAAVILVALATVVYGGIVPENIGISPISAQKEKAKFAVEIRLKIVWFFRQHRCNGALIDGDWILAPAQCVQNKPWYGNFEVLAGSTNYDVQKVFVHEKANGIINDIALIRLSSTVPYGESVFPINLPFPDAEFIDSATLYQRRSGEEKISNISLKLRAECTDTPGPVFAGHICAGDQQNSAVQGDEGSSLAVSDGLSGKVLIGILSFAKPEPAPAVFTKVSFYTDWILKKQMPN